MEWMAAALLALIVVAGFAVLGLMVRREHHAVEALRRELAAHQAQLERLARSAPRRADVTQLRDEVQTLSGLTGVAAAQLTELLARPATPVD
jgi:hypothetical protein